MSWGILTLPVQSIQYSGSAAGEIDVTSVSSTAYGDPSIVSDPEWSTRKLIKKSVDFAVVDKGEVSCDFFAQTADLGALHHAESYVGIRKVLTLAMGSTFVVTHNAFLTNFQYQLGVGDNIRGNCTFKLTDT
jgi:hypothetical protein